MTLLDKHIETTKAATLGVRTKCSDIKDDGWFVNVPTEHGGYHHSVALGLDGEDGSGALSESDARLLEVTDRDIMLLFAICVKAADALADALANAGNRSLQTWIGGVADKRTAYRAARAALEAALEARHG